MIRASITILLAATLLNGCAVSRAVGTSFQSSQSSSKTKKEAKRLFKQKCAKCHGQDGAGNNYGRIIGATNLTDPEWQTIGEHPRIGQVILEQASSLREAIPVVLHHHERFNGGGYPHGLRGTEIPLGARIVAVADAYHAMVHDRPYSSALAHEAALDELRANAGTQFDPDVVDVPWRRRLEKGYADEQRRLIGDTALVTPPETPPPGGTVFLCAVDGDGMMVSFIQSNYSGWMLGFGSGVVVPGTGVALHARGCAFTLEEGHPNVIAPRKRPFHTLAPAFLTREGRAVGPFGIMGGPMQPQGHVQLVVNQLDYGMNPQAALDAPRLQWISGNDVEVELGVGVAAAGCGRRPGRAAHRL